MNAFIDRLRKAEQGEYFSPSEQGDFVWQESHFDLHRHKKIEYVDYIAAFDTETTSFVHDGVSLGTMYCWMFGLKTIVFPIY